MPPKGDFDFTAEELDALFGSELQETPPVDSNNATEQQTPPTEEQANTTTTRGYRGNDKGICEKVKRENLESSSRGT